VDNFNISVKTLKNSPK